jgi:hypothetical protein
MATLSRIEANRRCNAQHSTGPRTPEGQAASSINALQSGIDAGSSVIPGEDPAALAALTERFYQDCQPQTAIESILVDNIVRASWRLRRFDRIDAEILIHTIGDTSYPSPNAPAGKAFHLSSSTQSRLQRRINDTSRLQREAIKDLLRIQAERPPFQPQTPPPAPPPASPLTETESSSPIGFVPATGESGSARFWSSDRCRPGLRRQSLAILLVALIRVLVHMGIVAGQAATQQQRQHQPQPFQALAVPCPFPRHCRGRGLHHRESASHAEPQFEIPGHQVQVALAAYLAPQHKNRDQGDQELRRIGETKDGHS